MIPVMQTKFTSEDRTIRGNCLAACVASLLEIPLSEVPEWETMGDEWVDSFYDFLESKGYECDGSYHVINTGNYWWERITRGHSGIDGYFIVGGSSPRPHVNSHAVIYKDGVMVHDPHPDGTGLLSATDIYWIERIL